MQVLTKQTYKIFWQHARKYPWQLLLMVVCIGVTILTDVYKPLLFKELIDIMSGGGPDDAPQLIGFLWQILAVSGLNWAAWRVYGFTDSYFKSHVMVNLSNTCYRYLQQHSYGFFNNNFVGSLVRKAGRYARAFQGVFDQVLLNIGRAVLSMGVIAFVLYSRKPILMFIFVAWLILYTLFQYGAAKWKLKYDIKKSELDSEATGYMADTFANNVNLKLFASTQREFKGYRNLTDRWRKMQRFTWNISETIDLFQVALMVLLEFIFLYIAIRFWARGVFTVGDFALIQAYLIEVFNNLWNLGRYIRNMYENLADANEMTEILTTPHEIVDIPDAKQLRVNAGRVEFRDVMFYYYENQKIFNKFNFSIEPGERVALIGPSGGGKTTIVKMLLRFMDIHGGEILVDGQNTAKVTQDSLRKNISLVPQEPILFHRTLLENIQYGKPGATKAEVIAAAKLAHCHEFIARFPEAYETFVGERGVKLSGGERQRVAIARAILKNAPILILDEATSSLDSESELLIQDALKNLMRGKTTMVIAHRLSTIMQMDRIVVLERGKITEQGKHEELLKAKQGTYQRLWGIQAGGFS
jgi:ATP-binding cassette, subfamily B, bacterial